MYLWREVDGTEHAFNRFINRDDTPWWTSMCQTKFSKYQVQVNLPRISRGRIAVTGRCVACIHLVDAGTI